MRRVLWLLAITLLLAGCSGQPPVADDPELVSTPDEVEADTTLRAETLVQGMDMAVQPVVTLLDAGKEPRQELRYRMREDYADTAIFDMAISMKTSMGGMTVMDMEIPATRMWLALSAEEVARDGSCRYRAEFFKVEVMADEDADPLFSSVYEEEMQKLVGVTTWGVMTARGFQPELETELPPGADAQMRQNWEQMERSMENMSAPFPAEAVGLGARWSVFMPVDVNALVGSQTATYELIEFTEEGARLAMDIVQDFPPQVFESEELPEGTTMSLTDCDSQSDGFMEVTYGRLVPHAGIISDMVMHTAIEGMGMTQNMKMDMKMDLSTFGLEGLR